MYFTCLPDHTKPGFNEQVHFSKFRKYNIIYNATTTHAHCDDHVGCLSFKTALSGEEGYKINNHHLAIRPGQFLILNDDQRYSCHIDNGEPMRTLSVFFKKDFASSVFRNALNREETLLDNPIPGSEKTLEFFQTLHHIDPFIQQRLFALVTSLEVNGYDRFVVDEHLVFLLHHLIKLYQSDVRHVRKVNAIKPSTQAEIYKRLCVAKDLLHSYYMDKPDLNTISSSACLSIPQLIRQFKSVFNSTPHQYLIKIRLQKAVELLKQTSIPVSEISWKCGFENVSAFCRAFKSEYSVQPGRFRKPD